MYQIDNHNELALSTAIPYLLQFKNFYELIKNSGDRYQVIEDLAWELLKNINYEEATGIWLDYIGSKVGQSRIYTPKPTDAFTFGGTNEEAFGAGKFKRAISYRGTKVARTDYLFKNAIRAKIIQNNTDTSLDELIQACKLLFNSKMVKVQESYPANISNINIYGSNLIEVLDANAVIQTILPAGVSLGNISFKRFYNYFYNDAFISYRKLLPATNDFTLSFVVQFDVMPTDTIAILSQGGSYISTHQPVRFFYNPEDGFTFRLSPSYYNDDDTGNSTYNDEEDDIYDDSYGSVNISGGAEYVSQYNPISLKVTRVGNLFSLYVNDHLVDTQQLDYTYEIEQTRAQLLVGTSNTVYFNSGSIYNLLIEDNTNDEIILNDTLQYRTIGNNNGVKFL